MDAVGALDRSRETSDPSSPGLGSALLPNPIAALSLTFPRSPGRPRRQAFDAPPKTDAGKRTVSVPPHVLPILAAHMAEWSGTDRVFIGRDGKPMRGDAVRQAFTRARLKVDMPGFRFHDLRHTGQTLAASAGATLKDLMKRLGHSSPAAAQRYLHAVDGRDAEIASALSDLAAHGNAARLPKSIVVKH